RPTPQGRSRLGGGSCLSALGRSVRPYGSTAAPREDGRPSRGPRRTQRRRPRPLSEGQRFPRPYAPIRIAPRIERSLLASQDWPGSTEGLLSAHRARGSPSPPSTL